MQGKKVSISEAAGLLRARLTENSQWGDVLCAEHLHELAHMRSMWPGLMRSEEIIIFTAILHKYEDDGTLTFEEMAEILYTLRLSAEDIGALINPSNMYHLLEAMKVNGLPKFGRPAVKRPNAKAARKARKITRKS